MHGTSTTPPPPPTSTWFIGDDIMEGGGVERGYLDIWYLIFFLGGVISDIWFFWWSNIWYLIFKGSNIWYLIAFHPPYYQRWMYTVFTWSFTWTITWNLTWSLTWSLTWILTWSLTWTLTLNLTWSLPLINLFFPGMRLYVLMSIQIQGNVNDTAIRAVDRYGL